MPHRAREAVEGMALESADSYKMTLLSGSLKKEADETLFLELALRGYDLSSLRENTETDETTAEIVNIG